MRAFVTGAAGGIGSVLCQRLSELEWSVVALDLRDADTSSIAALPGVDVVNADLRNESALAAAMKDCDTVFHLAAKVHAPADEPADSFKRINVEGTRAVVNAALAAGVRKFIFFSTVGVYPESGDLLDEDSAVNPSTPYAATKLAGEAIVLEQQTRMHVTVLRLPVVYGPRDKGNVGRMIDAIARKRFVIPGNGDNIKTMVAVENVVDAAVLCAIDPRAAATIYIVTVAHASTLSEIATEIARALNTNVPPRVSLSVMRAIGSIADRTRRAVNLPITRDQVEKLAANTRYSGEKLRRELGFRPRVSLGDGIRVAIRGRR
jgi:nucleoside-diphosphate-sugar epimerase